MLHSECVLVTLSILDLLAGFLPKYVQTFELMARNSCMSSLLAVSGMLLNCWGKKQQKISHCKTTEMFDHADRSHNPDTYFKKGIQLAFSGFDFVSVWTAKREVREHLLWAFDI